MKKLLIAALTAGLFNGVYAQKNTAHKYAKLITAEHAKAHLSIIASDAFEGRETGTRGAAKAAHYIAGEFKKLGLKAPVKGSYFFTVPLSIDSSFVKTLTINGNSYAYLKDFYTSTYVTGTTADKSFKADDIVYLGHKLGGDAAAELGTTDIAGKAVFLVNDGESRANIGKRVEYIQSKKPLIIITTSPNVAMALKGERGSTNPPDMSLKKDKAFTPLAPVFYITAEMANQLLINSGETFETFKASGDANGMQANQAITASIAALISTTSKKTNAADVLGYLPGTDLKKEVLVISAHYDHIGLTKKGEDKVNNGADDDGSGTTGILEIARAFARAKREGHGPRRSILFLGNVGEEKGLLGSEYYTDHPVIPLGQTITDLNIDMIGRIGEKYIGKPDSANYVYVIGSAMLSTDLYKISEKANATYTKLKLDYVYDDLKDTNRFYYRSDHYNFAKHGVPIIFYFNGVHADYHRPSDEVSKINFPLLAKRAQLVFYTAWDLANRNDRPVVDVNN